MRLANEFLGFGRHRRMFRWFQKEAVPYSSLTLEFCRG